MNTAIQAVVGMIAATVLSGIVLGQTNAVVPAKEIRITGRVLDVLRLPLAGTTVTLTALGSDKPSQIILTDEHGHFDLPPVSPQPCELRFDEPGFKSITIRLANEAIGHDIDIGTVVLQIGEGTAGPMFPAKAPKQIKPVTVCELLADLKRFSGKPVAIVGRLDCSWSLIDHTCHLAEDRCERPVTTQGYVWPNKILLVMYWEEGMPKPPTGNTQIDTTAALQKLSFIRGNTKVRFHKEPVFKSEGRTLIFAQMADVRDNWGAAYGRVFTASKLRKDGCGDEIGCGGFDGAPAALSTNSGSLRTYDDNEVQGYRTKR